MAVGGGTSLIITRQLEEEGVVRSNTTEARLNDGTTIPASVSHGNKSRPRRFGTKQELQPYCGCSALRIQPLLADLTCVAKVLVTEFKFYQSSIRGSGKIIKHRKFVSIT